MIGYRAMLEKELSAFSGSVDALLREHDRLLQALRMCSYLMSTKEHSTAARIMDSLGVPLGGADAIYQIRYAYAAAAPAALAQAQRIVGVIPP